METEGRMKSRLIMQGQMNQKWITMEGILRLKSFLIGSPLVKVYLMIMKVSIG